MFTNEITSRYRSLQVSKQRHLSTSFPPSLASKSRSFNSYERFAFCPLTSHKLNLPPSTIPFQDLSPPLSFSFHYSREPSILTNSRRLIVRAPANTPPALDRRRRIRTPARSLLEIGLEPIASISHAGKELVVLRCAHGVDCNVEVPVLAHVVDLFSPSALPFQKYSLQQIS